MVYLAAARLGGAALVVTRGEDGAAAAPRVRVVELPQLTADAGQRQAAALAQARQALDHDPGAWQGTLDAVCQWLWLAIIEPLAVALGDAAVVSLVPSGPLAALPLHAAWTEDENRPTGRRYAADVLVIGYAPSAGTLLHARTLAKRQPPAACSGSSTRSRWTPCRCPSPSRRWRPRPPCLAYRSPACAARTPRGGASWRNCPLTPSRTSPATAWPARTRRWRARW